MGVNFVVGGVLKLTLLSDVVDNADDVFGSFRDFFDALVNISIRDASGHGVCIRIGGRCGLNFVLIFHK